MTIQTAAPALSAAPVANPAQLAPHNTLPAATSGKKSLLEQVLAAWVMPYENLGRFLPTV